MTVNSVIGRTNFLKHISSWIQTLLEVFLSILKSYDTYVYTHYTRTHGIHIYNGSRTFHPFCGSPPDGSPLHNFFFHPYGWFTSRMIHPSDGFTPGRFTPGRFTPRTFHPPDISPPGKFTPRNVHPFGIFLIFKAH